MRDLVNGDIAPLFVLSCVEALPEGSKTYALMQDKENWRAYHGVGRDHYALGAIFNAINGNTAARGNFKKRPKFEPWPTPEEIVKKIKKKKKVVTLEKVRQNFLNMLGG